jgi:hypothetical protein
MMEGILFLGIVNVDVIPGVDTKMIIPVGQ